MPNAKFSFETVEMSSLRAGGPGPLLIWAGTLAVLTMICSPRATAATEKPERPPVEIKIRPIDSGEAAKVSYARQIRPIFVNNCLECHNAEDRRGQFETTSVGNLLKHGKKAGPGVVPGKPDDSAIVQYIRGLKEPQMPKGNPLLSEEELHLIRSWIAAGAPDDSAEIAAGGAGGRAGKAVDPRALAALDHDPNSREAINALLFSENDEQLMIARRALRLARLPPAPAPPKVSVPAFNPIDQFVAARWETAGLREAKRAPDLCGDPTFLRRAYLDLTGVIPTVEEAQRFLHDSSTDRRTRLVDELLARKEEYAAHWTPFWEDALASSTVKSTGGIASHGNYRDWLYNHFLNNTPYDIMVAQLLDPTMPGHKQSEEADANGKKLQISFIRNETHTDTIQSAANTAQVFLGTRMKCASCHSHFENKEWPQARFLAFAGMFAPHDLELIRCEKKSGQFIAARFPFDLPDAPASVPQELNARLHRLAQLTTDPTNPRFARTIVNRLWKRYLGLGLFEPADDFRLDRPPANPELLDWLADDFMRHGYDLKHTIRLILTSRTYQLQYDPKLEDHFDVAKPSEPRYYRSPSLRRLTAEQIIDSIRLAATQKPQPKKHAYLDKTSTALSRALGKPAARSEVSTSRSADVAVVQALEILNGEEFYKLVYPGKMLDRLAKEPDRRQAIEQLYWSALSRAPSPQEIEAGEKYLAESRQRLTSAEANATKKELVWIDDALPESASPNAEASWEWVSRPDHPVHSGAKSHRQGAAAEAKPHQQHYFAGAKPLKLGERDRLFVYVYLDPRNPPKEIMLQFHQGDWDHRAYWGEDAIDFGKKEGVARHPAGALPKAGEWARLEVPISDVNLQAGGIDGWSFDQYGGTVYWDTAGAVQEPGSPVLEPLGDMLWAYFASPEFQFIK